MTLRFGSEPACSCPRPDEVMDQTVRDERFARCQKHGRGTRFWMGGIVVNRPEIVLRMEYPND
jgi:hypothetical protein